MVTWDSNTLMGNVSAAFTVMMRSSFSASAIFLRRQLLTKDDIAVGKPEADGQHRRAQHQIGDEEHAVQLGAALFVAGGAEAGIVTDVGAAQPEAQQIQIGDDGQDGLIDAELTVPQPVQHNGGIYQRDDGAQRH